MVMSDKEFRAKAFRLLKEARPAVGCMDTSEDTALLRAINEFLNDFGEYEGDLDGGDGMLLTGAE